MGTRDDTKHLNRFFSRTFYSCGGRPRHLSHIKDSNSSIDKDTSRISNENSHTPSDQCSDLSLNDERKSSASNSDKHLFLSQTFVGSRPRSDSTSLNIEKKINAPKRCTKTSIDQSSIVQDKKSLNKNDAPRQTANGQIASAKDNSVLLESKNRPRKPKPRTNRRKKNGLKGKTTNNTPAKISINSAAEVQVDRQSDIVTEEVDYLNTLVTSQLSISSPVVHVNTCLVTKGIKKNESRDVKDCNSPLLSQLSSYDQVGQVRSRFERKEPEETGNVANRTADAKFDSVSKGAAKIKTNLAQTPLKNKNSKSNTTVSSKKGINCQKKKYIEEEATDPKFGGFDEPDNWSSNQSQSLNKSSESACPKQGRSRKSRQSNSWKHQQQHEPLCNELTRGESSGDAVNVSRSEFKMNSFANFDECGKPTLRLQLSSGSKRRGRQSCGRLTSAEQRRPVNNRDNDWNGDSLEMGKRKHHQLQLPSNQRFCNKTRTPMKLDRNRANTNWELENNAPPIPLSSPIIPPDPMQLGLAEQLNQPPHPVPWQRNDHHHLDNDDVSTKSLLSIVPSIRPKENLTLQGPTETSSVMKQPEDSANDSVGQSCHTTSPFGHGSRSGDWEPYDCRTTQSWLSNVTPSIVDRNQSQNIPKRHRNWSEEQNESGSYFDGFQQQSSMARIQHLPYHEHDQNSKQTSRYEEFRGRQDFNFRSRVFSYNEDMAYDTSLDSLVGSDRSTPPFQPLEPSSAHYATPLQYPTAPPQYPCEFASVNDLHQTRTCISPSETPPTRAFVDSALGRGRGKPLGTGRPAQIMNEVVRSFFETNASVQDSQSYILNREDREVPCVREGSFDYEDETSIFRLFKDQNLHTPTKKMVMENSSLDAYGQVNKCSISSIYDDCSDIVVDKKTTENRVLPSDDSDSETSARLPECCLDSDYVAFSRFPIASHRRFHPNSNTKYFSKDDSAVPPPCFQSSDRFIMDPDRTKSAPPGFQHANYSNPPPRVLPNRKNSGGECDQPTRKNVLQYVTGVAAVKTGRDENWRANFIDDSFRNHRKIAHHPVPLSSKVASAQGRTVKSMAPVSHTTKLTQWRKDWNTSCFPGGLLKPPSSSHANTAAQSTTGFQIPDRAALLYDSNFPSLRAAGIATRRPAPPLLSSRIIRTVAEFPWASAATPTHQQSRLSTSNYQSGYTHMWDAFKKPEWRFNSTDSFNTNASSNSSLSDVTRESPKRDWYEQHRPRLNCSDIPYIDSHCHIDFLLNRSKYRGAWSDFVFDHSDTFMKNYAGCITNFCDPNSYRLNGQWVQILQEEKVWAAFGCHPKSVTHFTPEKEMFLRHIITNPKVVALGEIGLDYSGRFKESEDVQKEAFVKQLQIALRFRKPLVIHCRDAESDCLEIMKKYVPHDYPIHRHCFKDEWKYAVPWLDYFINCFIGLTPVLTYKNAKDVREVARLVPLDRLLIETDAPYFVPQYMSVTGISLSTPGLAICVADEVAKLQNCTMADVLRHARRNTTQVYGI